MRYYGHLPSISFWDKDMKIIEENEDIMECIVECSNCGKPTKYGAVRMISGYVGCDNILYGQTSCFTDLVERVNYAKKYDEKAYVDGDLYIKEIMEKKNE